VKAHNHSLPCFSTPAATFFVLLDDEDPFLAKQDDVFIAEHDYSAAS
jgi:hypothetical protein